MIPIQRAMPGKTLERGALYCEAGHITRGYIHPVEGRFVSPEHRVRWEKRQESITGRIFEPITLERTRACVAQGSSLLETNNLSSLKGKFHLRGSMEIGGKGVARKYHQGQL